MDREKIENAVRDILVAIGEDPEREGLRETPERVARMCEEIFSGLDEDPSEHLKMFDHTSGNDIIVVKDIPVNSFCEHHLMPFFGTVSIDYRPDSDKIIGLSKLARIVSAFAKRPQLQERLTSQIANFLYDNLGASSVAVKMTAEHTCMTIRGIKAHGSKTVTLSVLGKAETDSAERAELLSLLN